MTSTDLEEPISSHPESENCGVRNDAQSETPQPQNSTTDDDAAVEHPNEEFLVWRKPWMVAMGWFFAYYILFFSINIIGRYWVREDWTGVLPGLGKT